VRLHRWLAFGISLLVWAMTFVIPLRVGVIVQLADDRLP
jgi:heme exporter protein D